MEGICGIIAFNGERGGPGQRIQAMADSLSDGEPLKVAKATGDRWALACSRWVEPEWSPATFCFSDDAFAVAGVVDIFNAHELGSELQESSIDLARLFLNGYKKWGQRMLGKVRGNFALVLLDLRNRECFAATDKIGIRPLYWYELGGTYYFGSRIGAIKAVCDQLSIDSDSIYAYIHYSMIPSPRTIYAGVRKLEPGWMLEVNTKGSRQRQYWDVVIQPKVRESERRLSERVRHCIESAVVTTRNGCTRAGQTGAFLSGGTDSSSVCGLLSCGFGEPVDAYSIGFPARGYDEMEYARIAARAFALRHHEYYMEPQDVLSSLSTVISAYDEPFDNSSVFPALLCARFAAENGARYMFAGDGGDEVFGGNKRYGHQKAFESYFRVPRMLRKGFLEPLILNRLEKLPIYQLRRAGNYIRRSNIPYVERIHSYRYFTDEEILAADFLAACNHREIQAIPEHHFSRLPDADALDRHLYMDMKLTITDNDLRKVTRACDLAHVRVRYPLLDETVVELGFTIPSKLKVKGHSGLRYIFKRAFQDFLPPEILKKEKHGFGLPIAVWLQSDPKMKQWSRELLFGSGSLGRGYFNRNFLNRLWELQLHDTTPYYGGVIWQLVMLEAWHRVHLQGETIC